LNKGCRELLEDIMDDEGDLRDFNLSSRVLREERRRQRERGRLERELEREREAASLAGGSGDAGSLGAVTGRDGVDGSEGDQGNGGTTRDFAKGEDDPSWRGQVEDVASGNVLGRAREQVFRSFAAWDKSLSVRDAKDRQTQDESTDAGADAQGDTAGTPGQGRSASKAVGGTRGTAAKQVLRVDTGLLGNGTGSVAGVSSLQRPAVGTKSERSQRMYHIGPDTFQSDNEETATEEDPLSDWYAAALACLPMSVPLDASSNPRVLRGQDQVQVDMLLLRGASPRCMMQMLLF
jgi:hypothetical protein